MAPGKKSEDKKPRKKTVQRKPPKKGIKLGSAHRLMSKDGFRVSNNATVRAIEDVTECIRRISIECRKALQMKKLKTLKLDTLRTALENSCEPHYLRVAAKNASADNHERHIIAVASVVRIVKKELEGYRISAGASDAFASIAEASLEKLAEGGRSVAKTAGRKTIKEKDMAAVIKISC